MTLSATNATAAFVTPWLSSTQTYIEFGTFGGPTGTHIQVIDLPSPAEQPQVVVLPAGSYLVAAYLESSGIPSGQTGIDLFFAQYTSTPSYKALTPSGEIVFNSVTGHGIIKTLGQITVVDSGNYQLVISTRNLLQIASIATGLSKVQMYIQGFSSDQT